MRFKTMRQKTRKPLCAKDLDSLFFADKKAGRSLAFGPPGPLFPAAVFDATVGRMHAV